MSIQTENRREAYYNIRPEIPNRKWYVVQAMKGHPNGITSEDVLTELISAGVVHGYDLNYVRPRITTLFEEGIVEAIGKTKSPRSGRSVTVWRLKNDEN